MKRRMTFVERIRLFSHRLPSLTRYWVREIPGFLGYNPGPPIPEYIDLGDGYAWFSSGRDLRFEVWHRPSHTLLGILRYNTLRFKGPAELDLLFNKVREHKARASAAC